MAADEEYDTSLLSYNEAVVYYHQKQYATSTAILEDLFCNVSRFLARLSPFSFFCHAGASRRMLT